MGSERGATSSQKIDQRITSSVVLEKEKQEGQKLPPLELGNRCQEMRRASRCDEATLCASVYKYRSALHKLHHQTEERSVRS